MIPVLGRVPPSGASRAGAQWVPPCKPRRRSVELCHAEHDGQSIFARRSSCNGGASTEQKGYIFKARRTGRAALTRRRHTRVTPQRAFLNVPTPFPHPDGKPHLLSCSTVGTLLSGGVPHNSQGRQHRGRHTRQRSLFVRRSTPFTRTTPITSQLHRRLYMWYRHISPPLCKALRVKTSV